MRVKALIAVCAFVVLPVATVSAQTATPTIGILERTLMVRSTIGANTISGTIFSIDLDGREYWITAKHILTGKEHPPWEAVNKKSVTLSILNPNVDKSPDGRQWLEQNFSVIESDTDTDIVVLAAAAPIMSRASQIRVSSEPAEFSITLGGDCEFLGFPFGSPWRTNFQGSGASWMPFIKHCTISAMADKIIFLDGLNNKGFSGGPVLYQTGAQQRILGVISGYYPEAQEVQTVVKTKANPNEPEKIELQPKDPPEVVNVNSGFFIAYQIVNAVNAIRKNPIGPLREAQ